MDAGGGVGRIVSDVMGRERHTTGATTSTTIATECQVVGGDFFLNTHHLLNTC